LREILCLFTGGLQEKKAATRMHIWSFMRTKVVHDYTENSRGFLLFFHIFDVRFHFVFVFIELVFIASLFDAYPLAIYLVYNNS
jgi:hypothetical protein